MSEEQDLEHGNEDGSVEFPPAHVLFTQGSKGGELFFLKQGMVELLVTHPHENHQTRVATVSAPAVLGTMTFLEGEARSATARALSNIRVQIVSQIQREKLLATVPAWFKILLKDLSGNLRNLNNEYVKLKSEHDILEKRFKLLKAKQD